MSISFIPGKDSELYSFENNYKAKLALHAESLQLDPAEVIITTEIINKNIAAYDAMVSKRADARSQTAEYYITRKAAVKELRRMSKKIKALLNYTESKGEDLQIISPKPVVQVPSEMQPVLKLTVNGHIVKIRFNKGKTSAINIYSRRGPETEFKFLAVNTEVQFSDDRENIDPGKPEKREYYAYYKEKNVEIGLKSDIVDVIVP